MQLTVEDRAYVNMLTGQFSDRRYPVLEDAQLALGDLFDDEYVQPVEHGLSVLDENLEASWARNAIDFLSFRVCLPDRNNPDRYQLDNRKAMSLEFKKWVKELGGAATYCNLFLGKRKVNRLKRIRKENDIDYDLFSEKEPLDLGPSVVFQTGVESSRHDQHFVHGEDGGKTPYYDGADERLPGFIIPYIKGTKTLNICVVSGSEPSMKFKSVWDVIGDPGLKSKKSNEYWRSLMERLVDRYKWATRTRDQDIKTKKNGFFWVYYKVFQVCVGLDTDGEKVMRDITLFSPMPFSDLADEKKREISDSLKERKKRHDETLKWVCGG